MGVSPDELRLHVHLMRLLLLFHSLLTQGSLKDRWRNTAKAFQKGNIIATVGANGDELRPLLERAYRKMEAEGMHSCE